MLYIILGLIALGAVGTGVGYWKGGSDAVASYQVKEQAAQEKIDAQAKQLEDDAVQKQSEVVAAFDKGRTEGQAQAKIVYVKGAQYVASDKGLSNPACVMGADSLQFLNGARSDLRTASLAGVPAGGLPGPGTTTGPNNGGDVHPDAAGRSAVSGVPQQPTQLRSTGEVPGQRLSPHPKPTPIK